MLRSLVFEQQGQAEGHCPMKFPLQLARLTVLT